MKTSLVIAFLLLVTLGAVAAVPDRADHRVLMAVRDLAKLQQVTEKPFKMEPAASLLCRPIAPSELPSQPHQDYYCHVFVDKAGLGTMKSGKGEYPVGTVIVKQKFADAKAESTELYTLMRKMEQGYDPEHGNWEYSIVNRKATQVLARGRIESCIECHKAYQKADYVTRLYLTTAKSSGASDSKSN